MLKPSRRHALLLLGAAPFAAPLVASGAEGKPLEVIGQYGEPDKVLTIYERDRKIFVDGLGIHERELSQTGIKFMEGEPRAQGLMLDGQYLPYRDFGREVVETIQAKVKADPAAVRKAALAATPPAEPAPRRPADLVDLTTVDPRIKLDIRYATSNNFMGFPLYERAGAYLQRPAAEALGRAQEALATQGYGLLIHDGYRPWFVTKMFWDATPPEDHVFVADPAQGSRHNRGCAVDLTLYDLKTGQAVEMTGRYDEMSTRSYADFVGGTTKQRTLRATLRTAMEAQGFTVYPQEWWHFDYQDWPSYGIGTVTFSELANRR
jgi:D-alanyl-D-alanine dipeptidase